MPNQKSSSSFLPNLTRKMTQVLEKEPLPSPPPELTLAPPSTPNYPDSPKPEMDESELAHRESITSANHTAVFASSSIPFHPNTSGSQPSSRSERRKSRKRILIKRLKPAILLENSGSVARDHLSSERTFLAYVRTSLVIATTGVALVQLFAIASSSDTSRVSPAVRRIQHFAQPLGATLVIFGLLVLAVGAQRYFVIQHALRKGVFPVTRFGVTGITVILAVIIIIVFAVLISARS